MVQDERARRKGETSERPEEQHASPQPDLERTVAFITNYAEDHRLALPGRIPGGRKDAAKLLPSSETTVKVKCMALTSLQGGQSSKLPLKFEVIQVRQIYDIMSMAASAEASRAHVQ